MGWRPRCSGKLQIKFEKYTKLGSTRDFVSIVTTSTGRIISTCLFQLQNDAEVAMLKILNFRFLQGRFRKKYEKLWFLMNIDGQRFFNFGLNLNAVQVELKIEKPLPYNIHQIAKLFKFLLESTVQNLNSFNYTSKFWFFYLILGHCVICAHTSTWGCWNKFK